MLITSEGLCGLDDSKIDYQALPVPVHREIVAPFLRLRESAAEQGFELEIVSGYRDFNRQLSIWNAKASGERAVLDEHCCAIDIQSLDAWQLAQAIMRWSALPGASRHHWGTDIDVIDRAAVSDDYAVQLLDSEVWGDGPFAAMHNWLDQQIDAGKAEGFYRPYRMDTGGIAPERWHLSYRPIANKLQSALTPAGLGAILEQRPIALKEAILAHLDEVYRRFIDV